MSHVSTACVPFILAMTFALPYVAAQDPTADASQQVAVAATGKIRRGEVGFRALYTMTRDGANVQYLTAAPGMISSSSPMWSHNGKYIAFDACPVIDQVNDCKMFVYAVDGPFRGQLTDLGYGNAPKWSPDDTQIVFGINSGNPIRADEGVWLMNANGSNRHRISEGLFGRFSPDGKAICYQSVFGNMIVYEIASGATRLLLPEGWRAEYAGGAWSPDGRRVMFVGSFEGKFRLATIDASGDADTIQIVYTQPERSQRMVGPPAWSPDGRQVAITIQEAKPGTSHWSHSNIYSLATDVPSAPLLLEGAKVGNINRAPDWHPDGKLLVFSSER